LFAGIALFGWYLSRTDLRAVGDLLGRLSWLAPLIFVPCLLVYWIDCAGWRLCFPTELNLSLGTLFRIRWAGEAVNNVLPSAYVGGEALKVYLLQQRGVPTEAGAAAAVVSKTAQTVAQAFFILLAAMAFLSLAGANPTVRAGMLTVLAGGAFLVAGLFWIQRYGLFGLVLAIIDKLGLKFGAIEHRRTRILEVDQQIRDFYRENRAEFYASTGLYLTGWLLDTLEIYVAAYLLGVPISWPQALAVEAFTGVAKILGMWIPGSLGVQDSGILLVGRLAGLPDALCVAYALLRRARELTFAVIGWIFLYNSHTDLQSLQAKPHLF
jgi:putative membrane protein